jgi:CO/xanthine dehydrogenase Mo-binding subunit
MTTQLVSHSVPFGNSLRANPLLSQWIRFGRVGNEGRVEVRIGKVELGQGIVTALGQIAAEELDVDWSRIQVVPASTDGSPDEGFTAGSRSIMDSGSALRAVCAQVRHLLLTAASAGSGLPVAELHVDDGEVRDTAGASHGSYWTRLSREDLDVAVDDSGAAKDPSLHQVVGHSVRRPDLDRKLTGAPAFVHDARLPGQLYGRVVRPPSPGACLIDVDDTAARALPAVRSVVRQGSFLGVVADREEEAIRATELLRAGARWQEQETLPRDPERIERLVGQPAEVSQVERRADPAAHARVVDVHRAT